MAVPTSFEESDAYLNRPSEMSEEECDPLPIKRLKSSSGIPLVTSCWKFTKEELEEINRTGRVWLTIAGDTMPPAALDGVKPF